MGILRLMGWAIPQPDAIVQISFPWRDQAREEASDILQQSFLVLIDGNGRRGVTGSHGQESAGHAAIRNQGTDLWRNVMQGDAGVCRNREDAAHAEDLLISDSATTKPKKGDDV